MASEGPNDPGTLVDDDTVGTVPWNDPGNAAASDDSYAIDNSASVHISHYLKVTNFSFSIPGGSIIDGIVVEIERKKAGNVTTTDEEVFIIKSDGTLGSENKADTATVWPGSDTIVSYGDPSDLWSEAWTPTDINDSDFGVVISADADIGIFGSISIDHIKITVYYTTSALAGRKTGSVVSSKFPGGAVHR